MIDPRSCTWSSFSTASNLWPFILISLWKPFGLFVITFVWYGPISVLNLVLVVSRLSTRTSASFSCSAFTTMSFANQVIISRPPMLTLPSWWPSASHMIPSRKILFLSFFSCRLLYPLPTPYFFAYRVVLRTFHLQHRSTWQKFCMYVCMYVCMPTCLYVLCMYVHACMRACLCVRACMCACMCWWVIRYSALKLVTRVIRVL